MGRKVDVDQLVGATEIAGRLGLSRGQVVHTWRTRYDDFPAPVRELGMGLLWHWPDIESWAKRHGKRPVVG